MIHQYYQLLMANIQMIGMLVMEKIIRDYQQAIQEQVKEGLNVITRIVR